MRADLKTDAMKTRTILLLLLVLVLAGVIFGLREYFRGPTNSAGRDVAAVVSADQLVSEFLLNEQAAEAKYLGQVVQVQGTASRVEGNEVLLEKDADNFVRCTFLSQPTVTAGKEVSIKGVFSGAILLLGVEVQLEQCAIVE